MIILLFSFSFSFPSKLQFHSRLRRVSFGRRTEERKIISMRSHLIVVSASDVLYLRLIPALIVVLLRSILCRKKFPRDCFVFYLFFCSPARRKETRLASEQIRTINLPFNRCLLESRRREKKRRRFFFFSASR